MVEGGDEFYCRGQQHGIAEHVARHVADTRDRERLLLNVDVDLAEVALDALPSAARGDRHLLVVVAGRSAGSEGVVEPEAEFRGEGIGGIGKSGGALVGSDHEIGVVVVVQHDARGVDDLAVDEIVRDVEQARDEKLVGGDAFPLDGVAAAFAGQLLRHEAAFGPFGHDDGILHLLRLGEAENLGSEVLRAIRPADAAAGDLGIAQVDALDPRAVDEDLRERLGRRQSLDPLGIELEGDGRSFGAARILQVEIRALRHADEIEEVPQDAVLVGVVDRLQRRRDSLDERRRPLLALLRAGRRCRIEALAEQREEVGRHGMVAQQRVDHVALAERRPYLAQICAVGPEGRNLSRVRLAGDGEPVVGIVVHCPAPYGEEQAFEPRIVGGEVDRPAVRGLYHHVM